MNFPIKISRGHHSDLYFPNRESLWEWLEKEETAWAWLLEDHWVTVDKALVNKTIERQYSAIQELKALTSDINLSAEQIERIFYIVKQAHTDISFIRFCLDDHESKSILAATANPALALGMLAQALKIPVSEESADTFAGRQAWLANLPNSLLALLPEKLEELDNTIEDSKRAIARKAAKEATENVLTALKKDIIYNRSLIAFLIFISCLWIAGAYIMLNFAHTLTDPSVAFNQCMTVESAKIPYCQSMLAQSAHQAWRQWSERVALYLFIIAAFSWGMRWLGFMILEAWAASQSVAKRWATLNVVMADTAQQLIKSSEADQTRIRQEVFGDTPASKPDEKKDEKKPEPTLELPNKQLGELADVLKKIRDLFSSAGK